MKLDICLAKKFSNDTGKGRWDFDPVLVTHTRKQEGATKKSQRKCHSRETSFLFAAPVNPALHRASHAHART